MPKKPLRNNEFDGVWTALVTPFGRSRVDTGKLAELVKLAAKAGLTGVVPLGSTGESAAMDESEHTAVLKCVIAAAPKGLKVMAGAGTNNTPKTVHKVRQAADLGADAALVVVPYYNKPTPAGLRNHFLTVADQSPIPIILYHIPSRCGVGIPLDLALELAKHPRIVGVKEAGGDVWRSGEIARRAPAGFTVLSGDDPLTLPLMAVGARGVVSVISNLAPKLTRQMVDACLKGDYAEALKLNRRMSPLLSALGVETNPGPIKEAMNLSGMNVGRVRPPLAPVSPASRKIIKAALDDVGKLA